MPRQARLDAPGTLHHVIIRGIEKRRIFDDDEDRTRFLSRLDSLVSETETKIYAWSLMTNHVHLLLKTSAYGLPRFMRRLLTGYAVSYNLRHHRHGHLFQNRYRSVVCDEDTYFRELVRYIHLNPLRAGSVTTIAELDRYRWSGHEVLMDRPKWAFQDTDYVLAWFGKKEREARKAYRKYVEEGIPRGRRPDLSGGGLIRSFGGWSAVLSARRAGEGAFADHRILGRSDFVEKVLRESQTYDRKVLPLVKRKTEVMGVVGRKCRQEGVSIKELQTGSRRGRLPGVRAEIAAELVNEKGMPLADVARELGVSTSAVSKILRRAGEVAKASAIGWAG
jgi:REP element-mobilizing transposase RayT